MHEEGARSFLWCGKYWGGGGGEERKRCLPAKTEITESRASTAVVVVRAENVEDWWTVRCLSRTVYFA